MNAANRLELLLAKYGDRFKLHPDARVLVEQVILELRREDCRCCSCDRVREMVGA